MRTRNITSVPLDGPDEQPPPEAKPGDAVADAKKRYAPGDLVTVCFWTGSPVNEYRRTDRYLAVERRAPEGDTWQVVREDFDWDTTARWKQLPSQSDPKPGKAAGSQGDRLGPAPYTPRPEPFQVTITWQTDSQTAPGTYRIVHYGRFKQNGKVERFSAASRSFEVKGPN